MHGFCYKYFVVLTIRLSQHSIAFTSCITKIYVIIIISKYDHHLGTLSLQCSFQINHYTTKYNLMMTEIVTHYINRESKVYSCFLEAIKAFDMIRYDKLFSMSFYRKMPYIIVRSMLDMYTYQTESTHCLTRKTF